MALKWTLKRSTKIPGDENIGITTTEVILDIETGSIEEAQGFFEDKDSNIIKIFGFSVLSRVDFGSTALSTGTVEEPKTRKPRTAKVEAVAPAPLPVPTATTLPPNALNASGPAPTAPPAPTVDADGIPLALRRDPVTNAAPAMVAAPPPPLPALPTAAAPPLAPTAPPGPPPVGVLGPKIVAALDVLKEGKADGGQALADWLNQMNLTIKGATYDEACRALLMISDEKLKQAAEMLKVAA